MKYWKYCMSNMEKKEEMHRLAILFAIAVVMLIGPIIMVYLYTQTDTFPMPVDNSQDTQMKLETEGVVQSDISASYVAYEDGEVTKKMGNCTIQVDVNEKGYQLVTKKDFYDSVSPGDIIHCLMYFDENDNSIGIIFAEK